MKIKSLYLFLNSLFEQKDDPFGISTTKAVSQLFKRKLYLPVYPFKLIIQSLLHDEVESGNLSHYYCEILFLLAQNRLTE